MQVCSWDKTQWLNPQGIRQAASHFTHLPLSRASASFTSLLPSSSCAAHRPKTHTLYSLDFVLASLISRGFMERKKTRLWRHCYWVIQMKISSKQPSKQLNNPEGVFLSLPCRVLGEPQVQPPHCCFYSPCVEGRPTVAAAFQLLKPWKTRN